MTRVAMGASVGAGRRRPVRRRYAAARLRRDAAVPFNQGVGAEMIAERWGLSPRAARRVRRSPATSGPPPRRTPAPSTREIVPVVRPTARRSPPTRASAADTHPLETAGGAEAAVRGGRHGHRRARLADLRRGRGAAVTTSEWAARARLRPLARVHAAARGRRRPGLMLTAPSRPPRRCCAAPGLDPRRHRRVRGQRGVRLGAAGVAGRNRRRPGPAEPRRRGDRPRPPARWLRCAADDHAAAPHAAHRRRYGLQTMCEGGGWPTRRCWNGGEEWAGSRDHMVPGPRHSPPAVVPSALPQQGRDRPTAVGLSPVHRGHGESCRTSGAESGTSLPMALTCHR